jgi:hypothetical protein
METTLLQVGKIAGIIGLLLVIASVLLRVAGTFSIGPFQTGTVMQAGIAGLATGCFLLLWGMSARAR